MTVNEYRKKHPNCQYCAWITYDSKGCEAKREMLKENKVKKRAKRCPLYTPIRFNVEYNADENKITRSPVIRRETE